MGVHIWVFMLVAIYEYDSRRVDGQVVFRGGEVIKKRRCGRKGGSDWEGRETG